MERLTLAEVADLLNIKDTRTAFKWCIENQVVVLSDKGTKRKYVMKSEFEAARLKLFIEHLKEKHGDKWQDAFEAHQNQDLLRLLELNQEGTVKRRGYQAQGKHEKRFLADLNGLLSAK